MSEYSEHRQQEAITIACYTGQIPRFAERAIESLYGSLYSSLAHLRLQGAIDTANTYAAWRDGELVTLLLFRQHAGKVIVLNEGMQLAGKEIDAFAHYVFSKLQTATSIHFNAVMPERFTYAHPSLRLPCTEDIVITLPATEEDYLARLGKSTRKSLRQSLSRLQRALPVFKHEVRQGHDVPQHVMREIIGFNHARMASKQRASALDTESSDKLIALIGARGIVGMASVDGRLCGGTLACRIGDDVYSLVNAHDPAYNAFSLGSVCRHLMIAAAIDLQAQRFHLLGGQFETKKMVLGERQQLDHVVLYRSRVQQLLHTGDIVKQLWRSSAYQVQAWLEHQVGRRDKTLLSTAAARTVPQLRVLKRHMLELLQSWRARVKN